MQVSEFKFIYEGNDYLIRSSYCPNNPRSCNQLVGKDFVAEDLNQDRVIDNVSKGNIPISQAQEIYDYCLSLLAEQGKINEVERATTKYTFKEDDFEFEISSFKPLSREPFNEFIITDKRSGSKLQKTSILIDDSADGQLDKLVKGGILLKDAQYHYGKVLEAGINQSKILKDNGYFVVE
jgi:hypothetical protein